MLSSCCNRKKNCQIIQHLEIVTFPFERLFSPFPSYSLPSKYCNSSNVQAQSAWQAALFAATEQNPNWKQTSPCSRWAVQPSWKTVALCGLCLKYWVLLCSHHSPEGAYCLQKILLEKRVPLTTRACCQLELRVRKHGQRWVGEETWCTWHSLSSYRSTPSRVNEPDGFMFVTFVFNQPVCSTTLYRDKLSYNWWSLFMFNCQLHSGLDFKINAVFLSSYFMEPVISIWFSANGL